jgi:16S rRNA (adenine1518-N6/adenine1519-N6)-dimethyltransferase
VIRKFLESKYPPREMVLMVQKEVAQRICAKPPRMNLLAVSVQFYADPKIIRSVKKTSFWPVPKVDSAIIKIKSRENNELEIEPQKFFRIVRAGFSHPRKQLINNLSSSLKMERAKMEAMLSKNGVDPKRRAETLLLQEWITLAKLLSNRVK